MITSNLCKNTSKACLHRVLVIGLGKSGLAAARFLREKGEIVVGFDKNPFSDRRFETHTDFKEINFSSLKKIVLSPGFDLCHPVLLEAKIREIEITGEA